MYNDYNMKNLLKIRNEQTIPHRKSHTRAAVLVNTLVKLGVDSIFGYPGASVLSIYNELEKTKSIKHFLVRHEQAAVHAAEGYARVSGKTGVVLVTSGPGFTNTVTGIANAYTDSTPLVVLAGDISTSSSQGKIFQNVDIRSMISSCAKKTYTLTKDDDVEKIITEAFQEANSGVKGPVVIALPRNLLETKALENMQDKFSFKNKSKDFKNEITKLNKLINSSTRPLVLVGGGGVNAALEINNFVSKINSPVVSTLMGIGIYPSSKSNYLGMIGINGTYAANTALQKCDLLISIGASFSDRSTCKKMNFAGNAKIVNINIQKNQNKAID